MGKIGEKHTKYQINKKDLSRRWSMFTYFCIGPNSPHCVMKKKNTRKGEHSWNSPHNRHFCTNNGKGWCDHVGLKCSHLNL